MNLTLPTWLNRERLGWLLVVSAALFGGMYLQKNGLPIQIPGVTAPAVATKAVTAGTYFYEKDQGGIPEEVAAAGSALNEKGIKFTFQEIDTKNGLGNIPAQYAVSSPLAVKVGLPCAVFMSNNTPVRVVKAPTTMQQILEGAK